MFNKITIIKAAFIFIIISVSSFGCSNGEVTWNDDKDLQVLHEKTFQISPGKSLRIEGSSGDITVTTWDRSEVYIKISGNEKAKERYDFNFENDSEKIEVTAKRESSFLSWGGIRLRFEVKIPSNFNPSLFTSGGDIKLAGVTGKIVLKTSGGDISTKYTNGDLRVATSGGNINFENNKGNIKGSTSGGDINAKNFDGDLDISTSGGNIELTGKNSKIDASTSGGNIELNYTGENKGIELITSGGNIRVNLPSDFNAYARLSSSGGEVNCEFTANNARKISSTKFEADLNNGGNPLIVKTSGGNIHVKKM